MPEGNIVPVKIEVSPYMKLMHRDFQSARMEQAMREKIRHFMDRPPTGPTMTDEQRTLLAFGFGIPCAMIWDYPNNIFETTTAIPVWVTWDENAGFWRIERAGDTAGTKVLVGTFGPDGPDIINNPRPSPETMRKYQDDCETELKRRFGKQK